MLYLHYSFLLLDNFHEYIAEFGNPLRLATSDKVAIMLIKNGANPSGGFDGSGAIATLLHHYCLFRRTGRLLKVILELGAAVNIPNSVGKTAIFFAQTPEAVDLLFNAGHSVGWEDITGSTPLHYMICHFDIVPTIKALLDAGCNANAKDKEGRTPMHTLCLDKDGDSNGRNIDHVRREDLRKKLDVMKLLADYGAKFGAQDNEGNTPLELLRIPPHEIDYEEWKAIKDYLMEMIDAQVNHGYKRARVSAEETDIEEVC